MKYVMFEQDMGQVKRKIPILFPTHLVHRDIAELVEKIMREKYKWNIKLVSAGEFNYVDGTTYGKSTTLNMASNPDDGPVIQMYDYMHGVVY